MAEVQMLEETCFPFRSIFLWYKTRGSTNSLPVTKGHTRLANNSFRMRRNRFFDVLIINFWNGLQDHDRVVQNNSVRASKSNYNQYDTQTEEERHSSWTVTALPIYLSGELGR